MNAVLSVFKSKVFWIINVLYFACFFVAASSLTDVIVTDNDMRVAQLTLPLGLVIGMFFSHIMNSFFKDK